MLRKRRLQQWLISLGRPECLQQLCGVRMALAADPDPEWACIAVLGLPREALDVAALWMSIKFYNFLRVGNLSFWGSGRPREPRRPLQKVGEAPPG